MGVGDLTAVTVLQPSAAATVTVSVKISAIGAIG